MQDNVKVLQIDVYGAKWLAITLSSYSGAFAVAFDSEDVMSVMDLVSSCIEKCQDEAALFEQVARIIRKEERAADFAPGPIKLF